MYAMTVSKKNSLTNSLRRIHLPIPLQNDSHCSPAFARNRLVGALGFVTFALKVIELFYITDTQIHVKTLWEIRND